MDRETKRRQASLREAFRSFDLDMSGKIVKGDMLVLAKAKRFGKTGVGSWDPSKNERLVKRMSCDDEGKISQTEFIRYFLENWHGGMETMSNSDFDASVDNFLQIAAKAQRGDKKRRRTRLIELFEAFDLDNNSAVDSNEFFKLARAKRVGTANPEWTSEKNESFMQRVDTDKNGDVDQDEFVKYFNETWHGGMDLFSNSDFDETLDFLMTLPGKLGEHDEIESLPSSPERAPEPEPSRSISPTTRTARGDILREVFNAFDIDQGGTIGESELLQLGQARRQSGQASGEWTANRNRRLIARMTKDNGASGNITESEFVSYFDDILPGDNESFTRETDNFLKVANMCGSPVRGGGGGGGRRGSATSRTSSRQSSASRTERSRVPKLDVSSPVPSRSTQSPERTPREREAGLNGIFRMLDMDRTGSISKKYLAYVTSQALEKGEIGGSWSTNQNRNALDNLNYVRGAVAQHDFTYFFKSIWYGGLENLSDSDFDAAIASLRSISRKVQTEGVPSGVSSMSQNGRSPSKDRNSSKGGASASKEANLSDEERKFVREKNLRLREVFSLLDFGRRGDLYRVDLRVLGPLANTLLDYMNEEGVECVSSSTFLEMMGAAMSSDAEEFATQADDLDACAKASRKDKEAERRGRRTAKLERVFAAFDLDGSGSIERDELFELGKARRVAGQAHGSWTEEKNDRLVQKLDTDQDGKVCKDEFTSHFEQNLTFNEEEFDGTMSNFVLVAEQVHLAKSRARAARLLDMDPIERAKYEAESYTKDADIDIFKARQEECIREDARNSAEKIALDKAIKELLARQGREVAKEELTCTDIIEVKTKARTEDVVGEHQVAEQDQEKSVKVEANAAEDVEATIQATQRAHQAHKKVARTHQEAVDFVNLKGLAKAQRVQEIADLEELLRLARQAFGIAEQEFEVASIDESQKAENESAAREVLAMAKQAQADAEEAHRLAHADMVEKTKIEKEKHQEKKYEAHKHVLITDMAVEAIDSEKAAIKEMEEAIESALKYARMAVATRDDLDESKVECWVSVEEKRVRGDEQIAAFDWWDAESARQAHQKMQLSAAEKKEVLKKAELRADWEDRRSVFARNRNRDPHEIEVALETKESVAGEYATAKASADETKQTYQVNADKARDSTEVAKVTREEFECKVEPKRDQIEAQRAQAMERGMVAYKEFLMKAAQEISGSGNKVDQEALFAKIERAVAMAMKGVDIYSSIPEKSLRSAREPAPPSKYDDEDYMPPVPAVLTPQPRFIPADAAESDIPKPTSPKSHAKSVHPWKDEGADTPLAGPPASESPVSSPRNARDDRDSRLDQILSPAAEKQFDNDQDQGEFETLQMAHKFYKTGRADDGAVLLSTVTSAAAKAEFNKQYGTSY